MPSRNVLKVDAAEEYYHVYARGNNKQPVFLVDADYRYFLSLLERYLAVEVHKDKNGVDYPNFQHRLDLVCYCLMKNHFHLLIYQREIHNLKLFMQCLMSSYVSYFNRKYLRRGPLFESRYKASMVAHDAYFQHISRYIHLNPAQWRVYPYSSLPYYFSPEKPDWLHAKGIESQFACKLDYMRFLSDYEENKIIIDSIKSSLADY